MIIILCVTQHHGISWSFTYHICSK